MVEADFLKVVMAAVAEEVLVWEVIFVEVGLGVLDWVELHGEPASVVVDLEENST